MNKLILAAPAILIGALAFSCLAQAQEPPIRWDLHSPVTFPQRSSRVPRRFLYRQGKGSF